MEKKVLVGLGPGLDGIIAAFLLKKQGFEVKLLSIQYLNKESIKLDAPRRKNDFENDAVARENSISFEDINTSCNLATKDRLEVVAKHLGVAYDSFEGSEKFREDVIGEFLGDSLEGRSSSLCNKCNMLTLKILKQRADELDIPFISTGHYAKVIRNQVSGRQFIMTANDLDSDQSSKLGQLKQEVLSRLILPLGDLQKKEVEKIADRNGFLGFENGFKKSRPCLQDWPVKSELIETMTPPRLRKSGSVIRIEDNFTIGQHSGSHQFFVGQTYRGDKTSTIQGDYIVVKVMGNSGTVLVGKKSNATFSKLILSHCSFKANINQTIPINCHIKLNSNDDFILGKGYFRSGNNFYLELNKPLKGVISPGSYVSVYEQLSGSRYQLLLQGKAVYWPNFYEFNDLENTSDEESPQKTEQPLLSF